MIQVDQLFEQLKSAVKYFPVSPDRHMNLNTFAVIPSWPDLNSDNLGKYIDYKDTSFFYSKAWENLSFNPSRVEVQYPIMVVWETSQSHAELFSHLKLKTTYALQISVLDVFKRVGKDGKIHPGTSKKVKEQIFVDTERMLLMAVKYLADVIAIQEPGKPVKLIHEDLYDLLEFPSGTKKIIPITNEYQGMLRRLNNNVQGTRFEGGDNDLFGTFINLNFEFQNCNKPEFNFHQREIQPIPDRNR